MDHLDQRPPKPRRGEGARLDKKDATRTLFHGLLGLDIADKIPTVDQTAAEGGTVTATIA